MSPSLYRIAADLVVAVHLGFVLFVMLGALLAIRWPRIVWGHVPAAIWGAVIEFGGWICPLTPLENYLRSRSGSATYAGDFVEQYVLPLLYPPVLTRDIQTVLGGIVLAVNASVYWVLIRRYRRATSARH